MNKKVTKNRCFLSKTAVFLARGNNSEPSKVVCDFALEVPTSL